MASVEEKEETGLIKGCLDGDPAAWEAFVQRYTRLIYYSIQKISRVRGFLLGEADIEDLHNQVFLSFMENDGRKLRQFQGRNQCQLSTWIGLITTRQTLDYFGRKHHQHKSIDEDPELQEQMPDEGPGAESRLIEEEKLAQLQQAVAGLPEEDRLFYRLVFIEERDPEDLSVLLATSVSNIYSKKSRLISKLRQILQG